MQQENTASTNTSSTTTNNNDSNDSDNDNNIKQLPQIHSLTKTEMHNNNNELFQQKTEYYIYYCVGIIYSMVVPLDCIN